MKNCLFKIGFAIFCVSASFGILSCASNSRTTAADSYEGESTAISVKPKDSKSNSSKGFWEKTGNAFSQFIFGEQKDVELDSTRLFTDTTFDNLKEEDAIIIWNIKSEKAGFSAKFQASTYHILFSNELRPILKSLADQYIQDFADKKLKSKQKKSYKIYGEFPIYIQWGTLSSMLQNYSDTKIQFGYLFRNGSPYFSMTIWASHNDALSGDNGAVAEESSTLHFYFTKDQILNLAYLLSDEKLEEMLSPYMETVITEENATQPDVYDAEK